MPLLFSIFFSLPFSLVQTLCTQQDDVREEGTSTFLIDQATRQLVDPILNLFTE